MQLEEFADISKKALHMSFKVRYGVVLRRVTPTRWLLGGTWGATLLLIEKRSAGVQRGVIHWVVMTERYATCFDLTVKRGQ